MARKKFTTMKTSAYNAALKKLKADPLWQDEMMTTAKTYVDHLTERAMEYGSTPSVALECTVDLSDWARDSKGTCDCLMIGGDTLTITDYKHGTGIPVGAEGNPQMRMYALGALKMFAPVFGDRIRRVSCWIDQPRLNAYSGETLTVDELLAWGDTVVKPKAALAYAGLGEYCAGDWCDKAFCRARATCRARAAKYSALEDFMDAQLPDADPIDPLRPLLSNAEIGDLLTRGEGLVKWYNKLKEYALTAILRGEAVDGWKAVEGRSNRAWTDQDAAMQALMDAGIDRAVLYRTTPEPLTAVEKVVKKAGLTDIMDAYIHKPAGAPALAEASDKRPAYNPVVTDFAKIKFEEIN
jgi:hypothetical protein